MITQTIEAEFIRLFLQDYPPYIWKVTVWETVEQAISLHVNARTSDEALARVKHAFDLYDFKYVKIWEPKRANGIQHATGKRKRE